MKISFKINWWQIAYSSSIQNLFNLRLNFLYFLAFLLAFQGEVNIRLLPFLKNDLPPIFKSFYIAIFFTLFMHCLNFIFNFPLFEKRDFRGQIGTVNLEINEESLIFSSDFLKMTFSFDILEINSVPFYYHILIPNQRPIIIPKSAENREEVVIFLEELERKLKKIEEKKI